MCDVLIRGSFMTFLDRFSRRAVDEKLDVEAGVLVAAHCVTGVRKRDATAPNGRKTGRRDDRCMLCVYDGGGIAGGDGAWIAEVLWKCFDILAR